MTHTAIYYTSNLISDFFANNIRDHLLTMNVPIVSISWKPIDFGENICVGAKDGLTPKPSAYNVYKQILIGARRAKTKYIVCCEDDALYVPEQFMIMPPDDTFFYNKNKWNVNPHYFYHRKQINMSTCVANRELMISTLETRFAKYNIPIPRAKKQVNLSEPGKYEKKIGLPPVKLSKFKTEEPILTFNHRPQLGGRRRFMPNDIIVQTLKPWGNAHFLWNRIWK